MYFKERKHTGIKNIWVFSCLLREGGVKIETINRNITVLLPLTSVTVMAINIKAIFSTGEMASTSIFILQQIIWEMINEIFNYRLSLS